MITRMILSKLFLVGIAIVVCCSMLGVASADNLAGFDSTCPPAVCSYSWDGLGGPVSGTADFTPAGYSWTFSFETAPALTQQCNFGYCTDTYGYGGTFSLTGPDGTLTGVVTSGYALYNTLGDVVDVNFLGQWNDGSYWHGEANVTYMLDLGQFSASFNAQPTPEPSSLFLFGSGILGVARMFRVKRKS
jgi:hypothetical protein